jgi:hypothetical protein
MCCPYCKGQDHSIFALGCELDSFRFYRHLKGFETVNYVRCQSCQLVFSNPRLKYSDTTLNDLFPEHARELGFTVQGTELYSAYITCCQTRELEVRTGSVDRIEFDTASFDVVYMEDVLEHLKQPFDFIDEAGAHARRLFVHTWVIMVRAV